MIKKIILTGYFLIIINFIVGCGLYNSNFIISKYPDRLIYVAGYDTELDLTGGEISKKIVYMGKETMEIYPMDEIHISGSVIHQIDFSRPGIYMVKVYNSSGNEVTFAIQVVEADYINNILTQKSD